MFLQKLLFTLGAFLTYTKLSLGDSLLTDIPCGPNLYCYPQLNTTWVLGTVEYLRWNTQYPPLPDTNRVDIKLFEMSNVTLPLKEWLNFNNQGFLPITLTSEYFPPIVNRAPNVTSKRWYKFLVNEAGKHTETLGPIFVIEDIPHTISNTHSKAIITATSTAIAVTTVTSTMRPYTNSYNINTPKSYTSGKAAGIVIGSILGALLLSGIVIFALRRNRAGTHALIEKGKRQDAAMVSSDVLVATEGINSAQLSPLTENDAYLIADTYRESLRKPDWIDETNESLL